MPKGNYRFRLIAVFRSAPEPSLTFDVEAARLRYAPLTEELDICRLETDANCRRDAASDARSNRATDPEQDRSSRNGKERHGEP